MELEYRFATADDIENLMQNLLEITFSSLSASDWQL